MVLVTSGIASAAPVHAQGQQDASTDFTTNIIKCQKDSWNDYELQYSITNNTPRAVENMWVTYLLADSEGSVVNVRSDNLLYGLNLQPTQTAYKSDYAGFSITTPGYDCKITIQSVEYKDMAPPPTDCDPSYPDVCIPSPPPDLDCHDIAYANFKVVGNDPHDFDGDGDGTGCETSVVDVINALTQRIVSLEGLIADLTARIAALETGTTAPQTLVTGTVFRDANGNGIMDADESGLSGVGMVAVGLADPNNPSRTTTDSEGRYSFKAKPAPATTLIQTTVSTVNLTLTTDWYTYASPQEGTTVTFDIGFRHWTGP